MWRIRARLALVVFAVAACSTSGDLPLGGPYRTDVADGAPLYDTGTDLGTLPSIDAGTGSDVGSGSGSSVGAVSCATGCPAPTGTTTSPTFTYIFQTYFAVGTPTQCTVSCHQHDSQMDNTTDAYMYLTMEGQISATCGPCSPIDSTSSSDLSWFGGNMPLTGQPTNMAQSHSDFTEWVNAGALNN